MVCELVSCQVRAALLDQYGRLRVHHTCSTPLLPVVPPNARRVGHFLRLAVPVGGSSSTGGSKRSVRTRRGYRLPGKEKSSNSRRENGSARPSVIEPGNSWRRSVS